MKRLARAGPSSPARIPKPTMRRPTSFRAVAAWRCSVLLCAAHRAGRAARARRACAQLSLPLAFPFPSPPAPARNWAVRIRSRLGAPVRTVLGAAPAAPTYGKGKTHLAWWAVAPAAATLDHHCPSSSLGDDLAITCDHRFGRPRRSGHVITLPASSKRERAQVAGASLRPLGDDLAITCDGFGSWPRRSGHVIKHCRPPANESAPK